MSLAMLQLSLMEKAGDGSRSPTGRLALEWLTEEARKLAEKMPIDHRFKPRSSGLGPAQFQRFLELIKAVLRMGIPAGEIHQNRLGYVAVLVRHQPQKKVGLLLDEFIEATPSLFLNRRDM